MSTAAAPWDDPAWLAEAHAWISEQVAACGTRVSGPIEQPHIRWWSTVFRVPTDDGVLWMKAAQPMYAFESRVTPFLAAHWPAITVQVVATDQQRGWMLSRDAGTRLREASDRLPVDHWADLLPAYAELQIAAAEHRRQLETLGEPDRTLPTLAADLRAVVDEPHNLLVGDPRGLLPDEVERLRERLDAFEADCRRLAEIGIPETLQHDDLHDGNAFVRDGRYLVFDWGDSCISHPFHTLAVTLRSLAYNGKLEPGGPEIQRLLDAYLEPWERIAPPAALREAADLARRTGTIGRAMAYRSWVGQMPPDVADEQRESIPYGLRLFLADGPWGSWDDGSSDAPPPPAPMERPSAEYRTARLVLRHFTAADLDAFMAMHSDPEVVRYVPYPPLSRDAAIERLRFIATMTAIDDEAQNLRFAAGLAETGELIGDFSLWSSPHDRQQGEIGFVVNPRHHGQGYASEAAAELLRIGFEEAGLHRITANCDARNTASWRVMERIGMRREAHFIQGSYEKGEWVDELEYGILADEWRSRR